MATNGTIYHIDIQADVGASTTAIKKDLATIFTEINATPQKVKIQVDKSSANEVKRLAKEFESLNKATASTASRSSLAKGVNQEVTSLKQRDALLKRALNLMQQLTRAEQNWTAAKRGNSASSYANVQEYTRQLRTAMSAFSSGTINSARFTEDIDRINKGFKSASVAIRSAGEDTKTFGQRISGLGQKFATWFGLTRIIMTGVNEVKKLVSASVELDTAMTQLQIVTKATDSEMQSYGRSVSNTAKEISASITDLIDSTTTYARLGYNMEESSVLAKYTSMLKNVGAIEVGDAQDAITSIIKAYDIDAAHVEQVMDKLVETGNNFPISVSGIAEGMTNASSALAAAGNTFEESVALLTAANTTIQNTAKSSTGLRTIAARIRNTTTELSELGEEPLTSAKYGELVNQLTKYRVSLTDLNGDYRSTYDIIQDLAGAWDDMTSMEQSAIATALAGTRQQAVFFSLIGQFKEAQGAMEAMQDSAGALEDAYAIHLDSIQAHIDKFKATFQGLGADIFDSDFLKTIVDIGTMFLTATDGVAKFVEKIGTIPTIIASIAAVSTLKGGGLFTLFKAVEDPTAKGGMSLQSAFGKTQPISIGDSNSAFSQSLAFETNALKSLSASAKDAKVSISELKNSMLLSTNTKEYFTRLSTDGETVSINNSAIASFEKLQKSSELSSQSQIKSFSNVRNIIAQYNKDVESGWKTTGLSAKEWASATSEGNAALGKTISMANGAKVSFGSYAGQLIKTKVATIGLRAASMALNAGIAMLVSFLIGKAIEAVTNFAKGYENASKSFKERMSDIRQSMSETTADIQSHAKSYKDINDSVSTIAPRLLELSEGVNSFGSNVSLSQEEYAEFIDLNNQLGELFPDLIGGFDSEGNSMLTLSYNADSLNSSLTELLATRRQLANEEIAKEIPELVDTATDKYYIDQTQLQGFRDLKSGIERMKELNASYEEGADSGTKYYEMMQAGYDTISALSDKHILSTKGIKAANELINATNSGDNTGIRQTVAILKNAEGLGELFAKQELEASKSLDRLSEKLKDTTVFYRESGFGTQHEIKDGLLKALILGTENGSIDNVLAYANRSIEAFQKSVNDTFKSMEPAFSSWMQSQDIFSTLSADIQNAATKMLPNINIDVESMLDDFGHLDDSKIKDYITGNIIEPLSTMSATGQSYLSSFFEIDKSDKRVREYVQNMKDTINAIAENSDFEYGELTQLLGFNQIADEYQTNAKRIVRGLNDLTLDGQRISDGMLRDYIFNLDTSDFETALDAVTKYGIDSLDDLKSALDTGEISFSLDIASETEGLEKFYDALKQSESGIGLNEEAIANLKGRYEGLNSNNLAELFERTTHGIHLNADALRELEDEYTKLNQDGAENKLKFLSEQYNDLTKKMMETDNVAERIELGAKRDELGEEINNLATLASMYDGLTSSYNAWLKAQETPDQDNMYNNISSGIEGIKELYDQGRVGVDDFREAVQLMTNQDLSGVSVDDIVAIYEQGLPLMEKFFTGNSDGLKEFVSSIEQAQEIAGKEWLKEIQNEDGTVSYELNFDVNGEEELANVISEMEGVEMSTEQVEILLNALGAYGWTVNLDVGGAEKELGLLKTDAEDAVELLEKLGRTNYIFNFETSDLVSLSEQIGEAKDILDSTEVGTEEYAAAQTVLAYLIHQKQQLTQPAVMSVDITALNETDTKLAEAISLIQTLQGLSNTLNIETSIGADTTDTQAKIQEVTSQLQEIDGDVLAKIGIDKTNFDAQLSTIQDINIKGKIGITPESLAEISTTINSIQVNDLPVKTKLDSSDVDKYAPKDKTASVNYSVSNSSYTSLSLFLSKVVDKNKTITYTITTKGAVTGASNALGNYGGGGGGGHPATAQGTAFARGKWGTEGNGVALGGELGREIVVRDGEWFTIGDDGAEFFNYKANDIIFNAEQTKQLLGSGKVYTGKKRGRAFYSGSTAKGKWYGGASNNAYTGSGNNYYNYYPATTPTKSSSKSNTSSKKEKEKIDWIEILLDRYERIIDRLDNIVESPFAKLSTRLKNASKELKWITKETNKQAQAQKRYEQEANSVGLSKSLAAKVREGRININEYSGSTAERIKEYQKWYEKSLDARDAVAELNEEANELRATMYEITKQNFEDRLQVLDDKSKRYDFSDTKTMHLDTAASRYNEQVKVERSKINIYNKEEKKLKQLQGQFKKYSEQWYSVQHDINEVQQNRIDAQEKIGELYLANFKTIESKFSDKSSLLDHLSNSYDIGIRTLEEKGRLGSTKYYTALTNHEKKNIEYLTNEYNRLVAARNNSLNDPNGIKMYSTAWYEMQEAINGVKEKLDEANLSLIEYENTMREIDWSYFDYLQDRISQITQESDFLISLLSESKLYKDNGQLTREGMATTGLHAENYNVYMAQADMYRKEVEKLNEEISKDPYNTDLISRREQLVELQRDSIKAAQDERKAIKELVADGIEKELSSLKKLIDTYTDSLDSAKDLYEYQKRVSEQTKNIASLEKQLNAYKNDTSEETKATIQKLKVELDKSRSELEETQYDRFVDDSKKLLDNLYEEYESLLNARLDNIDALIRDMIEMTNKNGDTIRETLITEAKDVGYVLSNEMRNIWSENRTSDVVAQYGSDFSNQLTTITSVLTSINTSVNNLRNKADEESQRTINNTKMIESQTTTTKTTTKKATTTKKKTTTTKKKATTTKKKTTTTKKKTTTQKAGSWKQNSKGWWYSYKDGSYAKGWKKIDSKWYFFDNSGYMKTGWVKSNGNWYYLNSNGSMRTGWLKENDKWYYLDKNGAMVTGEKTINGKTEVFGKDGVWKLTKALKAYATGGLVDYTGLAKLDGTPTKPELVLNATDTANFLALKDTLREIASKNRADLYGNRSHLFGDRNGYGVNIGDTTLNIMIEHVEDYNDFVNQLRTDKKFEKFVQSLTVDRIAGKNAMAKNSYIW